jgi:hypothetical protein
MPPDQFAPKDPTATSMTSDRPSVRGSPGERAFTKGEAKQPNLTRPGYVRRLVTGGEARRPKACHSTAEYDKKVLCDDSSPYQTQAGDHAEL